MPFGPPTQKGWVIGRIYYCLAPHGNSLKRIIFPTVFIIVVIVIFKFTVILAP